ncbi:BLUF domain-containing protein [Rubrimonas cliftonensis]|uniref:Sensors of blue-light using FAD n=1 Tax=Rubrimonas cliftonensis TaxID=89524 RepID=A0A1H4A4W4_9RHOB|nr:BLUF domain-containing protein [Rubrimonas cliftonensis]SEA30701.1 Sensors of blue-light using FAD [Rubrimonas cliftonensis]
MDLTDFDPRLLRLTYASRAVEWLSRDDLRAIADSAQKRNRAMGLTGLLLYVDGDFLQILEGAGGAVEQLFEMIENDPRNRWVTRLSTERVLRRAFADWSMGCFELGLKQIEGDHFFVLDCETPRIRPRFSGDFSVFLEQFYARNQALGRVADFARAV